MQVGELKVLSGQSNPTLVDEICSLIGTTVGGCEVGGVRQDNDGCLSEIGIVVGVYLAKRGAVDGQKFTEIEKKLLAEFLRSHFLQRPVQVCCNCQFPFA